MSNSNQDSVKCTGCSEPEVTYNQLLCYVVLRPIWTYSMKQQCQIIQRLKSNILRKITGAPWYISNHQLDHKLTLETVHQIAARVTSRCVDRLHTYTAMGKCPGITFLENPVTRPLKKKTSVKHRLQKVWIYDQFWLVVTARLNRLPSPPLPILCICKCHHDEIISKNILI